MTEPARTRDLRICPACWSVVHTDDLDEHDAWHGRLRTEAVGLARRQLAAERRQRVWRAVFAPRPVEVGQPQGS